jgi:hypothetical protein
MLSELQGRDEQSDSRPCDETLVDGASLHSLAVGLSHDNSYQPRANPLLARGRSCMSWLHWQVHQLEEIPKAMT